MPANFAWLRKPAAMLREPRRLVNKYGTNLAYRLNMQKVPFLPPWVDIEPNNTCNLRCQHCQVSRWTKPATYLDEKSFERILNQLPGLIGVKLQGMGEPLLNRGFMDMLREGERRGISMEFFTNGTLLSHKNKLELLELNNTRIIFSIDGATVDTFESIRVGSNFKKVIANVRDLLVTRTNRLYPSVSLATVVTARNLHEVPAIVVLAKKLGVDYVTLQTALTDWGKNEISEYNKSIRVRLESAEMTATLIEARRVAADIKIDLRIYSQDYYSRKKKCFWPWKRAFISANGDVVPCCIIADSDIIKMGNVFEQSFAEIWNSTKYLELRRRISNHELYDFCKNCYAD